MKQTAQPWIWYAGKWDSQWWKGFSLVTKITQTLALMDKGCCYLERSVCHSSHSRVPTYENNRTCRTKKRAKIGWEGETKDHKSPLIILRANPSRECGLKPQVQDLHECSPEVPQRYNSWAGTTVPKNTQPTEPGPCSLLQSTGVHRDEKPALGHITTIRLGQVSCPPTSPFPKDKHPLQINQITSSLSIWNDERVQSTSWILISTDAMQPTDFPAACSVSDLGVYKTCKFSCVLFLWKMLYKCYLFFIKPPCLSKMTKRYIFTLLFMAILWVYVPPMPILWPCKYKGSYSLGSWWVYVVLWQQDNSWICIV